MMNYEHGAEHKNGEGSLAHAHAYTAAVLVCCNTVKQHGLSHGSLTHSAACMQADAQRRHFSPTPSFSCTHDSHIAVACLLQTHACSAARPWQQSLLARLNISSPSPPCVFNSMACTPFSVPPSSTVAHPMRRSSRASGSCPSTTSAPLLSTNMRTRRKGGWPGAPLWLLRSNGRVGVVKWVLVGRLFFAASPLLLPSRTPGQERGRAEAGQGKTMALAACR